MRPSRAALAFAFTLSACGGRTGLVVDDPVFDADAGDTRDATIETDAGDGDVGADLGSDAVGDVRGDSSSDSGSDVVADAPSDGSTCPPGEHLCAGVCVVEDPSSCGVSCEACPTPPHSTATCDGGACGFVCDPGYDRVGEGCDAPLAPRPVRPLSTARSRTRRPTFRWALTPLAPGARVEICADRACTKVLQTLDAIGTSARATSDLPHGVVFWRLHAWDGTRANAETSATWQLVIPAASSPGERAWVATSDFDGDGFADVALGGFVYWGSTTGPKKPADHVLTSDPSRGIADVDAADVDGDGFVDLVVGFVPVGFVPPGTTAYVDVYPGSSAGLTTPSLATRITEPASAANGNFGNEVDEIGDVNGDGWGDVLVFAPYANHRAGDAFFYLGSDHGLAKIAVAELDGTLGVTNVVGPGRSLGDVDDDGFDDVALRVTGTSTPHGAIYELAGGASGPSTAPSFTWTTPSSAPLASDSFGLVIDAHWDVDGDGAADLIVSDPFAPGPATHLGQAFRFSAASPFGPALQTWAGTTDRAGEAFEVIAAGDVNGDGIDDVILDDGQVMSVVARTATGDGATLLAIDRGTWTGAHSKALGDVDGDGFDDVGVWHHDGTGLGYHLEVYAGGTSAPLRLVTSLDPATGL